MNNVICRSCGFVFVSPSPSANSLEKYYRDSYAPYDLQVLDYDIEKRIKFITRNAKPGMSCVEIGGSNTSAFRERLSGIFSNVATVELNSTVKSDLKSLYDIPEGSQDAILHYFVLEHIPNVQEFLSACYKALRPEGIMICEVPDIRYYPNDVSALILHEHTNHFSLKTLERINEKAGFRLMDSSSSLSSRSFGFVTSFSKTGNDRKARKDFNEYRENKRCFLQGLQRLGHFRACLDKAGSILEKNDKASATTILWGANDRLLEFLQHTKKLPDTAIVVDSNPLKKHFSDEFRTYEPFEAQEQIAESEYIFIFTRLNVGPILEFIRTKFGKRFNRNKVMVLDL